ncbi:hypothetical protein [Aminivibrio sp.]
MIKIFAVAVVSIFLGGVLFSGRRRCLGLRGGRLSRPPRER